MEAKLEDVKKPWEEPKDLLDRKKYADFLTEYLCNKAEPFVLNVNSPWGMGKTFFITHWHVSLKNIHPSIYVNAWETDFSEDPLVTVISALHEQLQDYLPDDKKEIDGFVASLKSAGRLLKEFAPIISKGIVKKAIGSEEGKALLEELDVSEEIVTSVTDKSLALLLKNHSKTAKSIKNFSTSLSELIENINTEKVNLPVFLFIDELDRCRPTYAIELLETVKHIFNAKNIIFIISTDSEQLQHSIRAIYGANFESSKYLSRFFHTTFVLPDPDLKCYCKTITENISIPKKSHYGAYHPWSLDRHETKPQWWSISDTFSRLLSFYSEHFKLPLRSLQKIVLRSEAIFSTNAEADFDLVFLLFILCANEHNNNFTSWAKDKIKKGSHSISTEENDLFFLEAGDQLKWDFYIKYGTDENNQKLSTVSSIAKSYLSALSINIENIEFKAEEEISSPEEHLLQIRKRNERSSQSPKYIDYFSLVELACTLQT